MSQKKPVPSNSNSSPGVAARPEPPPHFARRNDRGLIELVDIETGRIIGVQASAKDLLQEKWEQLVCIQTPEGPVWLEKGLNFDLIAKLKADPYSKVLGDLICEKIVEGMTLVHACQELNIKYSAVNRWRRENESFREALQESQRDRAEALHDEVLHVARTRSKPETEIAALQWAAEKGNAEKFGPKTKIAHDVQGAVTIVLGTGIKRPGDAGHAEIEAEARDVGPVSVESTGFKKSEIE